MTFTPVYQSREGPDGDCYEACLASILGLPLAAVPPLGREGWAARLRKWLATLGLRPEFLTGAAPAPAGYAVASCPHFTGANHAVVTLGGETVHDPSRRGLARGCGPAALWTVLGRLSCS